jgi:hypothetical protein
MKNLSQGFFKKPFHNYEKAFRFFRKPLRQGLLFVLVKKPLKVFQRTFISMSVPVC